MNTARTLFRTLRRALRIAPSVFSSLPIIPLLVVLLGLAQSAPAQPQQQTAPHLGYAYPAGGRQGSTFLVRLGGQFLENVTNAHVSGGGFQAKVVEHFKPLTQQQFNDLRDRMRTLQEKRQAANRNRSRGSGGLGFQNSTNTVWTVADAKEFEEIAKKISRHQRRPQNPAIVETVTLQVTLGPDAEPGERELRVASLQGLSNPLVFWVGQLPEFRKQEPRAAEEPLNRRSFRNDDEQNATPPTETAVTLPATVNGQILPGGVDCFRFQAHKGQQLVVAASARELMPYLADAVPGWFQATLALRDAKGKELAYNDDFRFHPDPVFCFVIPRDGEYCVEIKDAIYRGREDFVYRITMGELPFVTSIFPLGGPAGSKSTVRLKGWNLPLTTLTLDNTNTEAGIRPICVRNGDRFSNFVPFAVDTLPECLEQEPNNSPDAAQAVTQPVIVNGRISQPGDFDVFRIKGRAGDQIVAEVHARRLDSPLDSVLKLTDASGKKLAVNDDYEDKGSGLNTHHADSYLIATLTNDGTYYLHLGDAQRQGGSEYAYRLRISTPQPDFALRVVPSSINVRSGASAALTVFALRKDGFTNDIALALSDAPPGFRLSGGRVPADQDKVRLTLTPPAAPLPEPVSLSLEGSAFIQGKRLTRLAVPAEDMEQAFAYHHLVPKQDLEVAVAGRFLGRMGVKILSAAPVKIPLGGTAKVRIGTPSGAFLDRFDLELADPPSGLTIKQVSPVSEGAELVLQSDAATAKPGLKGNLIVSIVPGKTAGSAQKPKKQGNQRRPAVGALPAIPFEIVEQ